MTNPRSTLPRHPPALPRARRARGLSIVELLVALALGLVLIVGVASVYLFTKTAFTRQSQLSTLQQSVRTAFEYLGNDARMVGHLGCFTGSTSGLQVDMSPTSIKTNFAIGVEGFEFNNTTDGAYTLGSDYPADISDATQWKTNTVGTVTTIPVADFGGALTPGSDVLVIRTVVGTPIRLRADTAAAGSTLAIESVAGGKCSGGADKVSGFCAGNYGLVASCTAARAFSVNTIAAGPALTPVSVGAAYPVFPSATSEAFPLQTIAYYVKRSVNHPGTTSLYRRIFNGDPSGGVEQELIEDVESLQLRYGRDSNGDGAVDDYVNAQQVNAATDWGTIVTVRMSLLLRSATPAPSDVALPASAPVNDVAVSYPSGSRYDRRVFTTTVALRNKIAYFPPLAP